MLIVEDGSGKPDAEAYVDEAYVTAYFAGLAGNPAWTNATVPQREAAIRAATSYLDNAYAGRWLGYRTSSEQRLDWPRSGVTVDGVYVPPSPLTRYLTEACADLCGHALTQPDGLMPVVSEAPLLSKSVSVGGGAVSKSVTYASPSQAKVVWYRKADALVSRLLVPSRLVRI